MIPDKCSLCHGKLAQGKTELLAGLQGGSLLKISLLLYARNVVKHITHPNFPANLIGLWKSSVSQSCWYTQLPLGRLVLTEFVHEAHHFSGPEKRSVLQSTQNFIKIEDINNIDNMPWKQIDGYKGKIIPILLKNDVDKAGIFGSFARNQADEKSDIDILVHFKTRKSLFDLARLELELEKESRKKVEVITNNSINPLIREQILKEEVRIL